MGTSDEITRLNGEFRVWRFDKVGQSLICEMSNLSQNDFFEFDLNN